jgi:aldehyde dehydrogenase (NAD+)
MSGEPDVGAALAAARAAQRAWAARSAFERGRVLHAVATALGDRAEEFARAMSAEIGKPIGEGRAEIANAARVLDFYAGLAHEIGGDVIASAREGVHLFTRMEPLGTIGVLTPWNFPVNLPVVKLAPALLSGNAVLWKPASAAVGTSRALWECMAGAGVPDDLVALLIGEGSRVGAAVVQAGVDALSFTGSTEVGLAIGRQAAADGIPCLLELGGKNAAVVCADADLDHAARTIVEGAFRYAGQKCTATSRVIAVEAVAAPLVERMLALIEDLEVGPAEAVTTYIGPLISEAALENAIAHVDRAVGEGARLRAGGGRAREDGAYMAATVLDGVTPEMAVAREELFAPVVAVLVARDFDHAVELANDSSYGLSASVFTRSLEPAFEFSLRADVGAVGVNLSTAGLEHQAPFGGRRASGSGHREQGTAALDFYCDLKTVAVRYAEAG